MSGTDGAMLLPASEESTGERQLLPLPAYALPLSGTDLAYGATRLLAKLNAPACLSRPELRIQNGRKKKRKGKKRSQYKLYSGYHGGFLHEITQCRPSEPKSQARDRH
eukprot:3690858-Rhodomonas_salina.2